MRCEDSPAGASRASITAAATATVIAPGAGLVEPHRSGLVNEEGESSRSTTLLCLSRVQTECDPRADTGAMNLIDTDTASRRTGILVIPNTPNTAQQVIMQCSVSFTGGSQCDA